MEPIERHPESPEPADDVGLDDLLAQARWPEPSAASTRRLISAWQSVTPAREMRWRHLATAAAITLAVGLALVIALHSQHTIHPSPIAVSTPPVPKIENPGETHFATPALYVAGSRQPTARERMAMCDASQRRRSRTKPTTHQAIAQRDTTPSTAPPKLEFAPSAVPYAKMAEPNTTKSQVETLIDELSSPRVASRYAAARALAEIDGPATTSLLIDCVERNVHRREALAALLLCAANHDELANDYLAGARESREMSALVRSVEIQLKHF